LASALRFDSSTYAAIGSRQKIVMTGFPLLEEELVDLELERYDVLSSYSQIVIHTNAGTVGREALDIALWRGRVVGHPNSYVYMAITPEMVKGYVHLDDRTHSFGPLLARDSPGIHMLVDAAVEKPTPSLECGEPASLEATPSSTGEFAPLALAAAGAFRIADVAIDTDAGFVSMFQDAPTPEFTAAAYAIAVLGAAGGVYERDVDAKLVLSYLRIWPLGVLPPDYPYDSDPILPEFKAHWSANMGHVRRTLAVLLQEGNPPGCGGQGYVAGLCSTTWGYASFGIDCFDWWVPYPEVGQAFSGIGDIWIFSHETGHVFGSSETHCIEAYDPPIDTCASAATSDEACYNPVVSCTRGTIMSYCGSCSPDGLDNIDLEFHSRVIDTMREHIDAQDTACMREARDPVYVDRSNTGLEDGTAANPYNTVVEGAETVLPGGTVLITPGDYPETNVLPYPSTLRKDDGTGTVIMGE
jgi:hypothetical protein